MGSVSEGETLGSVPVEELKQVVSRTLEARGVLGTIRAQLRAAVFTALDEQERANGVHLENSRLVRLHRDEKGLLLAALMKECLEWFDLERAASVFVPEANLTGLHLEGRQELAQRLGLKNASEERPILLELLHEFDKRADEDKKVFVKKKPIEPQDHDREFVLNRVGVDPPLPPASIMQKMAKNFVALEEREDEQRELAEFDKESAREDISNQNQKYERDDDMEEGMLGSESESDVSGVAESFVEKDEEYSSSLYQQKKEMNETLTSKKVVSPRNFVDEEQSLGLSEMSQSSGLKGQISPLQSEVSQGAQSFGSKRSRVSHESRTRMKDQEISPQPSEISFGKDLTSPQPSKTERESPNGETADRVSPTKVEDLACFPRSSEISKGSENIKSPSSSYDQASSRPSEISHADAQESTEDRALILPQPSEISHAQESVKEQDLVSPQPSEMSHAQERTKSPSSPHNLALSQPSEISHAQESVKEQDLVSPQPSEMSHAQESTKSPLSPYNLASPQPSEISHAQGSVMEQNLVSPQPSELSQAKLDFLQSQEKHGQNRHEEKEEGEEYSEEEFEEDDNVSVPSEVPSSVASEENF